MSFCKYHPTEHAQYVCHQCELNCCSECVVGGETFGTECCPLCGSRLDFLGDATNAEPFWRRIDKSFKYPIRKETLMLIIGVAVTSAVLANVGGFIAFVVMLLLTGAMMKYSFICMVATANGHMQAPPISEAFTGGVRLILSLTGMLIIMTAIVFTVYSQLGVYAAAVLGLFYMVCFPAVLMHYALSDSILASINPLNILHTVKTIGFPYALLLAFIAMMSVSVATIHGLIGDGYSVVAVALQSMVSDYYMVVLFHVMGYILFINQYGFGYEARREDDEQQPLIPLSAEERLLATVAIFVKEGDFSRAFEELSKAVKSQPSERLYQRYFDLAFASRSVDQLRRLVPQYMGYLIRRGRERQIYDLYRKTLHVDKQFLPETPLGCHQLAGICMTHGSPELGVRLLNGLHRRFPDYDNLSGAYILMADLLEMIPKAAHKASEYRAFAENFAALGESSKEMNPSAD